MTKHRSHSAAFKRQVAEEFIAGETLHALSKRHDISRQLIRIWVGKFEAGALDDDVQAADLIQDDRRQYADFLQIVIHSLLKPIRFEGNDLQRLAAHHPFQSGDPGLVFPLLAPPLSDAGNHAET